MVADSTVIGPALTPDGARTPLGLAMGLVAVTAGALTVGGYLGGNVAVRWGWLILIGAIVCVFGFRAAGKRSERGAVPLLLGCWGLTGPAVAPTLAFYVSPEPQAVWLAGGGS